MIAVFHCVPGKEQAKNELIAGESRVDLDQPGPTGFVISDLAGRGPQPETGVSEQSIVEN